MMSRIILWIAVTPVLLSGCVSPVDQGTIAEYSTYRFYYEIPKNAEWELIGEWEYPGRYGPLLRYTTSILRVEQIYVEIYSGTILSGCCFWPYGIKLEKMAARVYWNPMSETTYSIVDDDSLTVRDRHGRTIIAERTPTSESFVLQEK